MLHGNEISPLDAGIAEYLDERLTAENLSAGILQQLKQNHNMPDTITDDFVEASIQNVPLDVIFDKYYKIIGDGIKGVATGLIGDETRFEGIRMPGTKRTVAVESLSLYAATVQAIYEARSKATGYQFGATTEVKANTQMSLKEQAETVASVLVERVINPKVRAIRTEAVVNKVDEGIANGDIVYGDLLAMRKLAKYATEKNRQDLADKYVRDNLKDFAQRGQSEQGQNGSKSTGENSGDRSASQRRIEARRNVVKVLGGAGNPVAKHIDAVMAVTIETQKGNSPTDKHLERIQTTAAAVRQFKDHGSWNAPLKETFEAVGYVLSGTSDPQVQKSIKEVLTASGKAVICANEAARAAETINKSNTAETVPRVEPVLGSFTGTIIIEKSKKSKESKERDWRLTAGASAAVIGVVVGVGSVGAGQAAAAERPSPSSTPSTSVTANVTPGTKPNASGTEKTSVTANVPATPDTSVTTSDTVSPDAHVTSVVTPSPEASVDPSPSASPSTSETPAETLQVMTNKEYGRYARDHILPNPAHSTPEVSTVPTVPIVPAQGKPHKSENHSTPTPSETSPVAPSHEPKVDPTATPNVDSSTPVSITPDTSPSSDPTVDPSSNAKAGHGETPQPVHSTPETSPTSNQPTTPNTTTSPITPTTPPDVPSSAPTTPVDMRANKQNHDVKPSDEPVDPAAPINNIVAAGLPDEHKSKSAKDELTTTIKTTTDDAGTTTVHVETSPSNPDDIVTPLDNIKIIVPAAPDTALQGSMDPTIPPITPPDAASPRAVDNNVKETLPALADSGPNIANGSVIQIEIPKQQTSTPPPQSDPSAAQAAQVTLNNQSVSNAFSADLSPEVVANTMIKSLEDGGHSTVDRPEVLSKIGGIATAITAAGAADPANNFGVESSLVNGLVGAQVPTIAPTITSVGAYSGNDEAKIYQDMKRTELTKAVFDPSIPGAAEYTSDQQAEIVNNLVTAETLTHSLDELHKILVKAGLVKDPQPAPPAAPDAPVPNTQPVAPASPDIQSNTDNNSNKSHDQKVEEALRLMGEKGDMWSNIASAINFYTSNGYTVAQASGLVGSFRVESGMDPTKHQYGNGPGRGIGQWEIGGRQNTLVRFANDRGLDPEALGTQLRFTIYELDGTESNAKQKILAANTPEEAALAASVYYERPNPNYAHNDLRQQFGRGAYDVYSNVLDRVSQKDKKPNQDDNAGKFTNNKHEIDGVQRMLQRAKEVANMNTDQLDNICRTGAAMGCYHRCAQIDAYVWGREASGYATALDQWRAMKDQGKAHIGDRNPPVGALLYYETGEDPGHVAVYMGDNKVFTNDLNDSFEGRKGGMYIADAKLLEGGKWNLGYQGWTMPEYDTAKVN